jgi:hypothetical protein
MRRRTIQSITLLIAIIGFGAALAIYLTHKPEGFDPLTYNPQEQKMYDQQLQMLGGKATVVTNDFSNWFASIWHGRALAGTVTVLTILAILIFRYIALHPDFVIEDEKP